MRKFDTMGAYKALLLAGCAGTVALATPAMAQNDQVDCVANPTDPACTPAPTSSSDTIVVTGSRIARQDFNSNSPMVTVGDELLENTSSSALETSLNKLPQFTPAQTPTAGGDIQPTATNTPGAATVSLRGLGTNRNLVLLDGRRGTPGNASGVVDISTLPSAAVERVEVITGGASATYGADAIAGVTNFILKKNFQGVELDGRASISQEGDGFEYQLSGIIGSDFADGRGNVSLALSMNTREASRQLDRDHYRSLYSDPQIGGNLFFIPYPGVVFDNSTGTTSVAALQSVFPGRNVIAPFGSGTGPNDITAFFNPTIFTDPSNGNKPFCFNGFVGNFNRGCTQGFAGFNSPTDYHTLANNNQAANYTDFYLVLPLTRYNAFARANYEINDWIGVFGQALFSHTETATRNQGGAIVGGWDVYVPYGTGVYTGSELPINVVVGGRNINTAGFGNPSSVILNGTAGYTGPAYAGGSNVNGLFVDATPGNLADNPTNPAFRALYDGSPNAVIRGCATSAFGGCSNNQAIGQFFPTAIQTLLNARGAPTATPGIGTLANNPVQLNYGFAQPRTVLTDVDTYSMIAGLEGSVPGTDFTWEAFVSHGESITFARQQGTFSLARTRSLLQSPGFGLDFVANSNEASNRQNVIGGTPFGFGSNIATCTSGLNIFLPADQISTDCMDAIKAELKNRSTVRQTIAEANLQGGLFALPAGDLRFALGASYRENHYEFINDNITTQNASFLDQTIGIYPSVDFTAQITAKELYGELLIPVLADVPFIQELNLEVGGRMSHYDTTGTSWTYKILGDWQINDAIRLRGGYNRAERSPNLAELFLTPQQTFAGNTIGDICSQRSNYFISANAAAPGNTAAQAADVRAVCAAVMDNTGGPGTAAAYYLNRAGNMQPAPGFGFSFPTIFGNPNLRPEVADTWTAGVVLTSPFTHPLLSRLRLSVDWYAIKLNNAIGVSPAATLQRCFDPFYNPAVTGAAAGTTFTPGPGGVGTPGGTVTPSAQAVAAATSTACAGNVTALTYDPAPGLGLGRITATYTNEGKADISGIDAQLDWSGDVGPGTASLNVVASYYLHYKVKELAHNPMVDYAGTFGTTSLGLQSGAFRYRTLTNLGYRWGPASLGLQWQHLPSVEDSGEAVAPTPNQAGNPNSYDIFHLNASYQVADNLTARFGVDNLFDREPPLTNFQTNFDNTGATPGLQTLRGGSYNANFYDTLGRTFYAGVNVRF